MAATARRSWPASSSSRPGGSVPSAHDVLNQAPPLVDFNPFDAYPALGQALHREGGSWAEERVRDFGAKVGSAEAIEHSRRALRNIPRLVTHDRYGNRVDVVESDPSWHWMLRLGIENG